MEGLALHSFNKRFFGAPISDITPGNSNQEPISIGKGIKLAPLICYDVVRNYTADSYREIIKKVKKIRPTIKVTSDFIVGFPGETHDEFLETMQLIEDIQFDSSFSFIYSPRPGTPASVLKDNVTKDEKIIPIFLG